MEKWVLDKIFEFVALIKHNGEKRDFIEKALKKFLIFPKKDFNIEEEIKNIFYNHPSRSNDDFKRTESNILTHEELFEEQDYILTIDSGVEDLLFYLNGKYNQYDNQLKKELDISVTDIINFSLFLNNTYQIDLIKQNYEENENIFSSKEELYYPHNLKYPDEESRKASDFSSFIVKDALILMIKEILPYEHSKIFIKNITILLDMLSFEVNDLVTDNKLRFQDKPLLKIDNESYIIINSIHLFYGLPFRLDNLLNKYLWYTEIKGKKFEKVAFKILEEINKDKRIDGSFFSNIVYPDGELDGLVNLGDTSWFLECKGRIPRSRSFKGNSKSVEQDIKKGISDAEEQALKAIKESEKNGKIGNQEIKKNKGILILVEGTYPNLNQNPVIEFKRKDENYPRYIISLLTLMEITRQHDVYYLEKFLKWRSDPGMPIFCMSELDYWDYFTSMQTGLDKKENYDAAKTRNIKIIFAGKRFNAPKYIKNTEKDENIAK